MNDLIDIIPGSVTLCSKCGRVIGRSASSHNWNHLNSVGDNAWAFDRKQENACGYGEPQTAQHLKCSVVAALLRDELRREFPDVRFSVRSRTYSMGASIDVRWIGDPPTVAVAPLAARFQGADFDGMQDLKTLRRHYMTREGAVGRIVNDVPEGARVVRLGADWIHLHRTEA